MTEGEVDVLYGDEMRIGYAHILEALRAMGYPKPGDERHFATTAERCASALCSMVVPAVEMEREVNGLMQSGFPSPNGEMVVVLNIAANSLCPHHLLPVIYDISVGYLPRPEPTGGFVMLGLSKLPRLVKLLARQPICQETLAQAIADAIFKCFNSLGVGVHTRGLHTCMICRGVEGEHSVAIVNALRGPFFDKPSARAEFFAMIATGKSRI